MRFDLVRFIIAVLIAAFVGLVLVEWIGPLIGDLHAGPITEATGRFLESPAGWLIGMLVGAFWYLRGGPTVA